MVVAYLGICKLMCQDLFNLPFSTTIWSFVLLIFSSWSLFLTTESQDCYFWLCGSKKLSLELFCTKKKKEREYFVNKRFPVQKSALKICSSWGYSRGERLFLQLTAGTAFINIPNAKIELSVAGQPRPNTLAVLSLLGCLSSKVINSYKNTPLASCKKKTSLWINVRGTSTTFNFFSKAIAKSS